MGWFWNSSDSSDINDKSKDAFSHLSPEMRSFLQKEAPIKPPPAPSSSPTAASSSSTPATNSHDPTTASPKATASSSSSTSSDNPTETHQPAFDPTKYSKYGTRYADIWAQYRPLSTIEAEVKTPQMAITDVYDSYKERKRALGRAAMENCAEEQYALHDCYAGGKGWTGKMTACAQYNRTLDRCFMSQQEFLRTLGFMADMARNAEKEERIQMHADKLYREQVRKEEEIEERAARGAVSPTSATPTTAEATVVETPAPEKPIS